MVRDRRRTFCRRVENVLDSKTWKVLLEFAVFFYGLRLGKTVGFVMKFAYLYGMDRYSKKNRCALTSFPYDTIIMMVVRVLYCAFFLLCVPTCFDRPFSQTFIEMWRREVISPTGVIVGAWHVSCWVACPEGGFRVHDDGVIRHRF